MSKTLQEIYSELNHKAIAEKAEDEFRAKQVSRRRFSERVMNLLPIQTVFALIVAFILSAPHTAELFIRITPAVELFGFNLVKLAPLVIEMFIFVIAALNEQKKGSYRWALWSMFLLSVSVNIVGGFVSLFSYSHSTTIKNPFEVLFYLIAPFAGILVSYLSIVSGRILLQFASGETKLEIESGEQWRGVTKFYALKEAFYNGALKAGASPSKAVKYAETQAKNYCDGEIEVLGDGMVQAVSAYPVASDSPSSLAYAQGTQSRIVQKVQQVSSKSKDFGFAGMAQSQLGVGTSQNSLGYGTIQTSRTDYPLPRMTSELLNAWLDENGDSWQGYSNGSTKRERAQNISIALTGHPKGYKTVERVFSEREIVL